ncbi:protein phosphatase 1 regulatory subunit 16A-like isoform X2 [Dendronephthya gigantea]|uniref:protein phosphatase 1 regulatory subunit 16A-like isoform X2 n=1 Tax=Dendronephthya gigantea TaxID=151771 RepID=UPI00106D524F|nr:protein phosphatase 1 regulatory subunit 16A-like isoform X2 [Dendronephthya gigantea]
MPGDRYDGVWVDEMDGPERHERAKKRRAEQLKRFEARESASNDEPKSKKRAKRQINFTSNIVMLEAATREDLDEVASLLENGVSPDLANEDGLTALHQSCIDGCDDMVKYLIEHKANVNACDNELWTPLHAAAACGHLSIIKYLLKNGADIMALNLDGNLPAGVVEENDEVEKFLDKEMLKLGYDEAAIEELRLNQGKLLLDDLKDSVAKGRSLDIQDEDGATAFHVAAANGWTNVIDFLLENEADFEVADNDGWQPIHAAAAWGHDTILELLVASGADLDSKTKDSKTPLDLTEETEIIELIEELKTKEVKYPRKGKGVRRKRSNTSNSSIKRTSIHEKSVLSHADTKAEGAALMMQLQNNETSEVSSPVQNTSVNTFDKQSTESRDENNSSGYISEGSSDTKNEEKQELIKTSEITVNMKETTQEDKENNEETELRVQTGDSQLKVETPSETKTIQHSPIPNKPPRRGTGNNSTRLDPQAYINFEIEPAKGNKKATKTEVDENADIKENIPKDMKEETKSSSAQNTEPKTKHETLVNNDENTNNKTRSLQETKERNQVEKRTTSTLPKLASSDKRKAPEPPGDATNAKQSSENNSKKANRLRSRSSESSTKKKCVIL